MEAYINSICSRAPPSTAPPVRPTRSAALLQVFQDTRRQQLERANAAEPTSARPRPPQPRTSVAAPLERRPPLPARQAHRAGAGAAAAATASVVHVELARTPSTSSAVSPWHPLFTSASPTPSPRPRQTSSRGAALANTGTDGRVSEADSSAWRWPAAYGRRRLYEDAAVADDVEKGGDTRATAADTTDEAASTPSRRPLVWTPWDAPTTAPAQHPITTTAPPSLPLRSGTSAALRSASPAPRAETRPPREAVLSPQQRWSTAASSAVVGVGGRLGAERAMRATDHATSLSRRRVSPHASTSLSPLVASDVLQRSVGAAVPRQAEAGATPAHALDHRCCRSADGCSLRELQEGLCARLQRRRHDRAATHAVGSSVLLTDVDAAVQLWQSTRVAVRQLTAQRNATRGRPTIATVQESNVPAEVVEDAEPGLRSATPRVLAERAAARAYLTSGASLPATVSRWHTPQRA
ncbi:hypothetical protein NESM_000793200 [Novymonas esmeraldas]|uniref:Uncharacterized protein n=1 Tax=Novymonas esmeraldas TaxID=1808958 RepID=A0AAW0EZM3_9TRYP